MLWKLWLYRISVALCGLNITPVNNSWIENEMCFTELRLSKPRPPQKIQLWLTTPILRFRTAKLNHISGYVVNKYFMNLYFMVPLLLWMNAVSSGVIKRVPLSTWTIHNRIEIPQAPQDPAWFPLLSEIPCPPVNNMHKITQFVFEASLQTPCLSFTLHLE